MHETYVFTLWRFDEVDELERKYGKDITTKYPEFAIFFIREVLFKNVQWYDSEKGGYLLGLTQGKGKLKGYAIIFMEYIMKGDEGEREYETWEEAIEKPGRITDLHPDKYITHYMIYMKMKEKLEAITRLVEQFASAVRDIIEDKDFVWHLKPTRSLR